MLASCGSARTRLLDLARGEKAADPGTDAECVRAVHSGLVAVCATLPDGRRQLLCLAGPGELLCTTTPPGLTCWVEALTPTVLCEVEVPHAGLSEQERAPVLATMAALARGRLETTLAHLVALGRLDGTERVIAFLVEMAVRFGRREADAWRVPLAMTRDDTADYLGLNADSITRILRRLQREGLVSGRDGADWVLPDLGALEARLPARLWRHRTETTAARSVDEAVGGDAVRADTSAGVA